MPFPDLDPDHPENKKKILVGVVNFSSGKDYSLSYFNRMMEACIEPHGWDIVVVGDRPVNDKYEHVQMNCTGTYADDMLAVGREYLLRKALREEYDQMLWQGVDCYWQNKEGPLHVSKHEVPIVSALTSARTDYSYACATRFISEEGEKRDISRQELQLAEGLVQAGFPGADAIFIDKTVFHHPFASGHTPWYARVAAGEPNLNVEEFWLLRMWRDFGITAWVDPHTKVWHHHDVDDMVRMWPGTIKPASELSWEGE